VGSYLGEALSRTPDADRKAFWRDHVRAEPSLVPVRSAAAMLRLARQYGL
jgi:hypothetical protein